MEIHLARDGSALGVFSAQEVREGLAAGRYRPSDLAWRAGMAAWAPLAEWPEFAQPSLLQAAPSPALVLPAWERRPSLSALFVTMGEVILSPGRTFEALPKGGLGRVIGFQYAAALPALVIGSLLLSLALFAMAQFGGLEQFNPLGKLGGVDMAAGLAGIFLGLGCVLVLIPLLLFVGAAFVHLLLLPWSPAGDFGQTYRAYGYVTGAFLVFNFIPCLNYVAGLWSGFTLVIALSRVHRLTWWKVVLSLVVPACVLLAFLLVLPALTGSRL